MLVAVDPELLRPTLGAHTAPQRGAAKPWRLGSQVYVAFFGGPVAAGLIAGANALRLRMGSGALIAIAALALVGVGAIAALSAAIDDEVGSIVFRLVGLAAWGGMWALQRTPARVHEFASPEDEPHASLWGPGLAAVVAGLLVEAVLRFALVGGDA